MRVPFFYSRPVQNWISRFMQRMLARTPHSYIGGRADPYMIRWHVIKRNRWLNIYFHSFKHSDDDRALHDHPWWNMSLVLYGGYWEHQPLKRLYRDGEWGPDYQKTIRVERCAGDIVFRGGSTAHRIELIQTNDTYGDHYPCYTLFLTGPRFREWGFYCPQGWKGWRDFTGFRTTGKAEDLGPGCND